MQSLYQTLDLRHRPEDIAQMVLDLLDGSLSTEERKILEKAATNSLQRGVLKLTSMMQDFARPVPPQRQVRKAEELFELASILSTEDCADAGKVEDFIRQVSHEIRKIFGRSDFKADRLDRRRREEAGLDISRRRYNKLFRHLARLERKVKTYVREQQKYEFTRIGKSSLATKITREEFSRDPNTACFIAYYTARCQLRSEFTIAGQQRPYDEIADMLFHRCQREKGRANWWIIAHVYPAHSVLSELSDVQKGQLLGRWLQVLHDIAELLREVWGKSNIVRETMIVRRGNDSSTWNNTANAWNKARASWVALLDSLGMREELDAMCLGKVLRLMAADVAAWHRVTGGDLDPDTQVWSEVPLPWEVLSGEVTCTREMVENICRKYGVDVTKKGWTAPPPTEKTVAAYRPTPELVHGITVSSPQLAALLKKAGWFSGKHAVPLAENEESVIVRRDQHGFVTGVESKNET